MLQRHRFALLGILVVLTSALVSYAVSAAVPSALLPAGTTRYASAYATINDGTSGPEGWTSMEGMTKFITIPSGKTADVMVIFCGELNAITGAYVYVRALIRGTAASPSEFQLHTLDDSTPTGCAYFQKSNVTSGSPPVAIQWRVAGAGTPTATVWHRSMFVIVNIH
jgi:hypothetical protein